MTVWLFIVIYAIASPCGLYFLKLTFNRMENLSGILSYLYVALEPTFWLGMSLYVTSFLSFLYILSVQNLNRTVPLLVGVGYVGSILISRFLLRESFSWQSITGIALIGFGMIFLEIVH